MRLPSRDTIEKAGFVLGFGLLAFLYGFAANGFGWFPNSLMGRAWQQARSLNPLESTSYSWLTDRVYDRQGVRQIAPEQVQPGLILISSSWERFDWAPGLQLINRSGETVHEWRIDPQDIFPEEYTSEDQVNQVHGSHLFENGDVLVNFAYVGTARLDACGEIVWSLRRKNHHSIASAGDGSFWIPGRKAGGFDYPGLQGKVSDNVEKNVLLRVSSNGEVLKEIEVLEVLYDNDLERRLIRPYQPWLYRAEEGSLITEELTHLNDIEPLPEQMADEYPLFEAGDILVSLKHINLVFVLDPDSREVKWHAARPFIEQHDPDFIGGGWIGVFDNNMDGTKRGSLLGGSRIVALQPHTDSVEVLFSGNSKDPFYTSIMGKWQQLGNGNLLLTEAEAGRIVEVSAQGRPLWEFVVPRYDETRIPEVPEGSLYNLSKANVSAWSCSHVDTGAPDKGVRQ